MHGNKPDAEKKYAEEDNSAVVNRSIFKAEGNNSKEDCRTILGEREREVLLLVAEGFSSRQIGEKLCISTRTVEKHRANIICKLNIKNAKRLIVHALEYAALKNNL